MSGEDIRQARLARGLSVGDFAAAVGCDPRSVRRWEAGHGSPAGIPVGVPVLVGGEWAIQWWRTGWQGGPVVDGRRNRTPFAGGR